MAGDPTPRRAILFDERGVAPAQPYVKGQWRLIASHTSTEIRGFFGDYRFLSNFWPAVVAWEGATFPCVENAYKAAKFAPEQRPFFLTCTPYEAVAHERAAQAGKVAVEEWDQRKVAVMRALITQKFEPSLNPELSTLLRATGDKFLEETNWWCDTFWGVYRTTAAEPGVGHNTLGRILMDVRAMLSIASPRP